MIRCLITNGKAARDEAAWLRQLAAWMERGVELIQIRERELTCRELAALTRRVLALANPAGTKILVNDRADIALACGAHGVHLREGSAPLDGTGPEEFRRNGLLISAACHRAEDVSRLAAADYIVLAPVFDPRSKAASGKPLGLAGIRAAARLTAVPLLALGGITRDNEQSCLDAGAAGIAAITYFGEAG